MATSRPVRIAWSARPTARGPTPAHPEERPTQSSATEALEAPSEHRKNVGGSQRALRIAAVYLVALAALYTAFVLYDRTAPGGTSSPEGNGVLLFTGLFVAFAVGGAVYTLHPAPRSLEVRGDGVTVVGRWGARRELPPLSSLSMRVARRYPSGWLSDSPVEQVELWGSDVPLRTYLVDSDLFRGVATPGASR